MRQPCPTMRLRRSNGKLFADMISHPFRILAWILTLSAPLAIVRAVDVPRWQPHDFSFTAKLAAANPFMVPLSATVTAPDGKTFALPGFFDGQDTWKIRVSPNAEGRWSLVTKSGVKELDGKTAEHTCVRNPNPNVHGVLRVDQEHPHHFIFEDRTRFFWTPRWVRSARKGKATYARSPTTISPA